MTICSFICLFSQLITEEREIRLRKKNSKGLDVVLRNILRNNIVLWSVTLKIGALTKRGLFFPVVCFIHVFDQTLAEQLYRDKGLLIGMKKKGE